MKMGNVDLTPLFFLQHSWCIIVHCCFDASSDAELATSQDRVIPLPKITTSIFSPMLPPSILIVLLTVDTVSG